jgi:alcohol dehydrogenase, propanol-preferring
VRAMVLTHPAPGSDEPLELEERPPVHPSAGEVAIAIEACGVCRTDLQLCAGDLTAHGLPIVPGHQIVGRVTTVGDGVDPDLTERLVGVAWIAGTCGVCRFCRSGRENLCEKATFTGWDRDGGYATQTTARADFVHPLPDVDPTAIAPLLCGGAIGYRCLGVAGVDPGDRLGLYGFGASAHIVLQIALHRSCEVYVATRSATEQQRALEMGATWAGPYDERPPVPLDEAITFAPVGEVVIRALEAVDRGGTVAINAIHLDEIPAFSYDLLWWERQLRSVANVTRDDVRELLTLATEIPITTAFDAYPIEEANRAMRAVRDGTVNTAAVLRV